jgi:23S rRNA-/tRNA-specific pseudouridylate synthase
LAQIFSQCLSIQKRKTRKFYLALVRGHVVDDKIDISAAIGDALDIPA